ncbi:MAG: DNA-deoxyinosine glycosylase [Deltaproteobacteria bacterium]|nr:DNA-deoxyinosine glycosylase [Deltaproteobacteria bacterium]MBW2396483.1 DNA-deoxyinosine glycosylase [Deltaproteobacteria bacterium]
MGCLKKPTDPLGETTGTPAIRPRELDPAAKIHGFEPIADPSSTVLVLGSMPGKASLEAGQYYAHPRNHFWRILGELLGFEAAESYAERICMLRTCRIALWDVLRSCTRETSLDSDIVESSIVPNDLPGFLLAHPAVRSVFFNGAKAEQLYRRHVTPALHPVANLTYVRLPSTSPANASVPYAKKLRAWASVISNA